jgi:hypothetical protein
MGKRDSAMVRRLRARRDELEARMKIVVRVKNIYGNKTVYPVCENAQLLARIAGHSTLTSTTVDLIKKLGYVVEVEQTEPVTL